MDGADASGALRGKPFQRVHLSSYVLQIRGLRIRNLLTYDDPANEDSGWIELGRRALIVGPNGSGKTNIIRALRLLRAAVGLEGSIQETNPEGSVLDKTKLYSYLHDRNKSSAGIDLEISLSEGEAVDACQLFCSYQDGSQGKWISPGPSCEELKERLAGDVWISFSWISADGESPLDSSDVKAFYSIWFSKANFGVFLRAEPSQMTTGLVKNLSEYIYCSKPEDDLKKLYKRYDEVNKNCSGQKPFETRRKICEGGLCGGSEPECAVLQSVRIDISPFKEIAERAGITGKKIDFYPAGYILLRAVLNNIIFVGSERTLSDASKLTALRRFIDYVVLRCLIKNEPDYPVSIIDSTLGWAREEQLDAYLRNVEPFLAHLHFSSDHEKNQRFQKISECFSQYFHNNVEISVKGYALEQIEAWLREQIEAWLRPPPAPSTHVERAMSELLASQQDAIASFGIYLREKTGGRDVEIPIDMAGQGHRELLSLLTALIGRPGSVVFLDEPASNMHPTLLSQFLMDLLGHGKCSGELGRNQAVVITHSPAVAKLFMEADVGEKGLPDLSILRVHRDGRVGASVIKYLTPDKQQGGSEEFLKKAIGRIVDPSVLFARGVVLCEGPADRAFLREALRLSENSSKNSEKWNELLRNDVELVWMNSKNNLVTYDKVLNQLGIPYVAILDFDALCEVSKISLKASGDERKEKEVLVLTPGQSKESKISLKVSESERKEIRVLTLDKLDKLNNYRYVLLLGSDSVPDQLECNNNSVQDYCNNEKIKEKNNNKKKNNSKKCELEGFLKRLEMDLSRCTDNNGKLEPESVPECVESQDDEVKGKIKQMGDILFKLIDANILGGSTNATTSY